jgi:hypothetical protein
MIYNLTSIFKVWCRGQEKLCYSGDSLDGLPEWTFVISTKESFLLSVFICVKCEGLMTWFVVHAGGGSFLKRLVALSVISNIERL